MGMPLSETTKEGGIVFSGQLSLECFTCPFCCTSVLCLSFVSMIGRKFGVEFQQTSYGVRQLN